jgi:APA family basic amino acid/polyamine antiporter
MTAASSSVEPAALRRVLTFWPLVFYGLGVIVGAGIYVAIGIVIARAGAAAPLSFVLAGIVAALTGLCYAELASRYPDAAGAAAYVQRGFGSRRLARAVGAAVTAAVAISAASIARGAVQYLVILLPVAAPLLTAVLVAGFTAIAAFGVRESVGLAAAIGVIEVGGLIVAIVVGFRNAGAFELADVMPAGWAGWHGVAAGAFIAFFAFIGFETLANMAEEVKDARRTVPRGIVGAIAASMVLYVAVVTAAVAAGGRAENPLLALFKDRAAVAFAAMACFAVANGVLVHIVMLARLFYGMARNGQLPAVFGAVHPRRRTPVLATVTAGAIVMATALAVPFERLLVLADALTLGVFVVVDLALWRVKRTAAAGVAAFAVPAWVPPVAAALAGALMLAELFG